MEKIIFRAVIDSTKEKELPPILTKRVTGTNNADKL